MFAKGFYTYDPTNYHGPLYFYLLGLSEWLFGRSVTALRIPPLLFGCLLSFVPFLYRRYIGDRAAWLAAYFFAVSPAAVFFSRYSIHETGFALASALTIAVWIRIREEGFTTSRIFQLGGAIAFMATMKENFILLLVALFLAEGMWWWLPRLTGQRISANRFSATVTHKQYSVAGGLIWSVVFSYALIVVVFSAMGRDPNGIANFFNAFSAWFATGQSGNGHEKPLWYFIKILFTHEWLALLGVMFSVFALVQESYSIRILSAVGCGLGLGYSLVNYKTPWCLMSFYWALILVAAYWLSQLIDQGKTKRPWIVPILTIGILLSGLRSHSLAYVRVDGEDPYIYGQTYRELMGPIKEILDRVEAEPDLANRLRIQVLSGFTWPLPFYLGEIKNTGYYSEANLPAVLDGDYIILDEKFEAQYSSRIQGLASGAYLRGKVPARQWAGDMVFFKKQ
jgi:uncharacterized protein (TIGR03663 family)